MIAVQLAEARDEGAFGGKAVQLGTAVRAGLPVQEMVAADAAGGRHGEVLEQTAGCKQLAVRSHPEGQTQQEPVSIDLPDLR